MSVQEANRAYGRLRHQEVLADLTVREAATARERYKDLLWPRRKTREMKRQVRELEAALLVIAEDGLASQRAIELRVVGSEC